MRNQGLEQHKGLNMTLPVLHERQLPASDRRERLWSSEPLPFQGRVSQTASRCFSTAMVPAGSGAANALDFEVRAAW